MATVKDIVAKANNVPQVPASGYWHDVPVKVRICSEAIPAITFEIESEDVEMGRDSVYLLLNLDEILNQITKPE